MFYELKFWLFPIFRNFYRFWVLDFPVIFTNVFPSILNFCKGPDFPVIFCNLSIFSNLLMISEFPRNFAFSAFFLFLPNCGFSEFLNFWLLLSLRRFPDFPIIFWFYRLTNFPQFSNFPNFPIFVFWFLTNCGFSHYLSKYSEFFAFFIFCLTPDFHKNSLDTLYWFLNPDENLKPASEYFLNLIIFQDITEPISTNLIRV